MDKADKEMIKHLEMTIKELAMERAMILKTEVMTEEEVTNFINEAGEKYGKKYAKMDAGEIILEKLMEIFEHMKERKDGE